MWLDIDSIESIEHNLQEILTKEDITEEDGIDPEAESTELHDLHDSRVQTKINSNNRILRYYR